MFVKDSLKNLWTNEVADLFDYSSPYSKGLTFLLNGMTSDCFSVSGKTFDCKLGFIDFYFFISSFYIYFFMPSDETNSKLFGIIIE